jgi:cyclopropane-fatty-acyl-phospholipid synthase
MPTPHAVLSSECEKAVRRLSPAFRTYVGPCFGIRLWDESVWLPFVGPSAFTISFHTQRAWKLFASSASNQALAECFINGDLEIEGDLRLAIRTYEQIRALLERQNSIAIAGRRWSSRLYGRIRSLINGQTPYFGFEGAVPSSRSDRPYDFYRAWLGNSMVYSSAYFHTFQEDLEQAQFNGIEHICHKLALNKGDRFLDMECDWGSLLLHAASVYEVSAHGFCHNEEQVSAVELRILQAGLHAQCKVEQGNVSDTSQIALPFDKIVSVSLSRTDDEQLDNYFQNVFHKLRPGGLFLCGFGTDGGFQEWSVGKYPSEAVRERQIQRISRILESAENAGFSVRGVEDFTVHLEETLRRWFSATTKHRHAIERLAKRKSLRELELYLACSSEALERGEISFYQILLNKNIHAGEGRNTPQNSWPQYVVP